MKKYLLPVLISILALLVGARVYLDFKPSNIDYSLSYVESQGIAKESNDLLSVPIEFDKKIESVNWNQITATSVYAFNPVSGQVYYEREINSQRPIASITKLMTALVAYEEYGMTRKITIIKTPTVMDRPLGLKIGDKILVSELLQSTLIASNNDSPTVLATHFPKGETAFIKQMNEKTKILGMKQSHFSNPTGYINTNNYSTAFDLGILSSVFIKNSDLVAITSKSSETIKIEGADARSVKVTTTNALLGKNKYIKGLKTGFTYQSGECLILYYKVSESEQLITIVLNATDRFKESAELYKLVNIAFD